MWKTALLSIFLALALSYGWKIFFKLGLHKHYIQHHPGNCSAIPGVEHGSEDFAVTSKGEVFITTGLVSDSWSANFTEYYKKAQIRGGILLYQFNQPDKGIIRLDLKDSDSFDPNVFRPHGIDMIEDKVNSEHLLFVVNHPPSLPDRIEKFRFLPKTNEVEHLKTYTDKRFHNLNDVAAVDNESFYATNICYSKNSFAVLVELLSLIPWGSIVFYSHGESKEVVKGLNEPNGIILSKDGSFAYVGTGDSTQVYARNHDNSFTLKQNVFLDTSMDNLIQSQDGKTLFAGSTPIFYKLIEAFNAPKHSLLPAKVLALPLRKGLIDETNVNELLYDHGRLMASASVAVVIDGKMLVGSVFDKLVLCDVKIPIP